MQEHWLTHKKNNSLIIFVLGWAADHRVVEHIAPKGYDILCVYDYRDFESVPIRLPKYDQIYLFAWSFGVWVAEQIFSERKFTKAIALNGSPLPVDDLFGIELRRLSATIRGLASNGTEAFDRRAYGNSYEVMKSKLSPRTLEENISELTLLQNLASLPYSPAIEWNKAIVGSEDQIFPTENLLRYWGDLAEIVPLPHYPFEEDQIILREIESK